MRKVKDFLLDNLKLINKDRLSEKELTDLFDVYNDWFQEHKTPLENKVFFQKEYSDFSLTLDCLIVWNLTLWYVLLHETYEEQFGKEITQKVYFFHLQIHLLNNLISIKHLYELGFDTQAKTIYRNSIEISDLALCILFKKDFFKNHIKPLKNKPENPFVSPKNKTVAKTAENVIKEINDKLGKGVKGKNIIDKYWKVIREQHYEKLSESAHGNFYHNAMNSFKKVGVNHEVPAVGGGKWLGLEKPLAEICLHQIAMKRYFTWALDLKHNIDLFDNSNVNHKLIWYLDVVIAKKLMLSVAKPMIDNE